MSIQGLLSNAILKLLRYFLRKLPYLVVMYVVTTIMWKTHKKLKDIKKGNKSSGLKVNTEEDAI